MSHTSPPLDLVSTHIKTALWSDGEITIEGTATDGTRYRVTLSQQAARQHIEYLDAAAEGIRL